MSSWYSTKPVAKPAAKADPIKKIKNKTMDTRVVTLNDGNYAVGSRIDAKTGNLDIIFVRNSHKKPLTNAQISAKKPSVKLVFPHTRAVDTVSDALYDKYETLDKNAKAKAANPFGSNTTGEYQQIDPAKVLDALATLLGVKR